MSVHRASYASALSIIIRQTKLVRKQLQIHWQSDTIFHHGLARRFLPVPPKLFLDRFGYVLARRHQVPSHKVVHGMGKIFELSRIHVRASGLNPFSCAIDATYTNISHLACNLSRQSRGNSPSILGGNLDQFNRLRHKKVKVRQESALRFQASGM